MLELPARKVLPVMVYSAEPELLRPVFTAISGVQATFRPISAYDPKISTGIVLLDHFAPPSPPSTDSIWMEPPSGKSPIAVRNTEQNVKLKRWLDGSSAWAPACGPRICSFRTPKCFRMNPDDIAVAESEAGPLIVARPGKPKPETPKIVAFGFHPVRSGMKYELTTPLLFANILRWMAPDIFRSWELTASAVGTVDVELESEADPSSIRVVTEDGKPVPFTVQGRTLRFFAATPGIVRVLTGDRELVYSMTLPQPGDVIWKATSAKRGLPGRGPTEPASRDIWQWLAIAGATGLARRLDSVRTQEERAPASNTARNVLWRKAS